MTSRTTTVRRLALVTAAAASIATAAAASANPIPTRQAAIAPGSVAATPIQATPAPPAGQVAPARPTTPAGVPAAQPGPGGGSLPYTGGQTAPPGEFAFVAGIRNVGATRFFCTGSLVDRQWILTAAHCVDGSVTPAGIEVVVGDTDLNTTTDPAETRSVDRIVVHHRWGGDAGDSHDIAMVHLTAASTFQPIYFGLPSPLVKGFKRCASQSFSTYGVSICRIGSGVALGWGRTPSSGNGTSPTLRKVNARIFNLGPKKNMYWRVKSGACPGDSGGPLLSANPDGSLVQIGIASYAQHGGGWFDWLVGGRCSSKGWDFYTNVSGGELLRWFERVMSPLPPPPPPSGPSCNNPTKPTCQEP